MILFLLYLNTKYIFHKYSYYLYCSTRNNKSVFCSLWRFPWLKGQSHYSDNQSPTSDNHFLGGGCRRLSEVGKCLSMIAFSRRLVVRELHRQPLADLRQPLFWGVVFGGIRWSANDCRWSPTVGDWLSEQFVGERFSLQHRKPFADQTSWAFTVHRPWIWIKMVWAFSTHIVYFRFARPQTGGLHSLECATSRALSWPGDVSQPVHACCLCTDPPPPPPRGGHSTFNWSGCAAGGWKPDPVLNRSAHEKIYPVLIYLTKDVHMHTLF